MSKLTKLAGGMIAVVSVALMPFGTSFAQGADVARASTSEAPAQSLLDFAPVRDAPVVNVTNSEGHPAHLFLPEGLSPLVTGATDYGPLVYHAGGSIMPRLTIYTIFWNPPKLQNGSPATMDAGYQTILNNLAADYAGHDIASITTQYYQTISGKTTYVSGLTSSLAGTGSESATYLDTDPYPASGCKDQSTPAGCITDAQLSAELLKVIKLKGWTAGLDRIYVMFTAQGEGSCLSSSACAYTGYCGYHSHVLLNGAPVLYANMPYGDGCVHSAPSPNANPAADAAANAMSHEVTETVTDPLGNAWFSAQGNEIGDLCAYNYGANTYDKGFANQSWNGHFYELQREFDNHYGGCSQVGP
jgi:hypothetical protein